MHPEGVVSRLPIIVGMSLQSIWEMKANITIEMNGSAIVATERDPTDPHIIRTVRIYGAELTSTCEEGKADSPVALNWALANCIHLI